MRKININENVLLLAFRIVLLVICALIFIQQSRIESKLDRNNDNQKLIFQVITQGPPANLMDNPIIQGLAAKALLEKQAKEKDKK